MKESIELYRNNKHYFAEYVIEKGIITVISMNGSKSTQLGGSDPVSLAKTLLSELTDEGKAMESI